MSAPERVTLYICPACGQDLHDAHERLVEALRALDLGDYMLGPAPPGERICVARPAETWRELAGALAEWEASGG